MDIWWHLFHFSSLFPGIKDMGYKYTVGHQSPGKLCRKSLILVGLALYTWLPLHIGSCIEINLSKLWSCLSYHSTLIPSTGRYLSTIYNSGPGATNSNILSEDEPSFPQACFLHTNLYHDSVEFRTSHLCIRSLLPCLSWLWMLSEPKTNKRQ